MTRRCGVTSLAGAYGCCREADHGGPHCAHPSEQLTGTAGVIVAGRSRFATSYTDCDGTEHPTGDRLVASRAPGNLTTRFDLVPPDDEGTTAP